MERARLNAILLIGPTGAGKTPLGEEIARRGWNGRGCAHFDFGARLRAVAAGREVPARLSAEDRAFVVRVLEEGALLEDDRFYIAEEILRAFAVENGLGPDDLVILNGLPRHVGQAEDVDRVARVELVIHLECTPEVVRRRIRTDAGGDRAGRVDDDLAFVERKLELFRKRTAPLLDHYRALQVEVVGIGVEADSSAEQIWKEFTGR